MLLQQGGYLRDHAAKHDGKRKENCQNQRLKHIIDNMVAVVNPLTIISSANCILTFLTWLLKTMSLTDRVVRSCAAECWPGPCRKDHHLEWTMASSQ